ncbi:BirA family biotin operon repressor/biotin-[acetyl-CoA-carboxylase] ligase [Crenobacter luteus]|uniref:biotin--[acetyl-CoA-carboxylase] ligase n=1 Tax=Crenobacter luteus TaxID=1452487 RepID=UPI00104FA569|nr:biotin--[acetyl-CoA-carboxylase] ligase [Crenobacter luteus]TCP13692.1 BirA family biotin operon repressor/biotin-[acetyl-CoA-carboxylase] ligase [Crenobacter luteus]
MSDAHAFAALRALSDGRFHSGEDIARALGCSRTLVWQALRDAEADFGLTVFKVRGQGYKLPETIEWLDVAAVREQLSGPAADMLALALAERVDSTNTQLMRRVDSAPHGLVLAAEWQDAGRGRLGRAWRMRLGGALAFSLLWRFDKGPAELSGLSLAVGVALARTLARVGAPVALKWPNDVLLGGKKLAGVLIELSGDVQGPASVVIGVGVNLAAPGDVGQPVAGLADAGVAVGRNALLAALLSELAVVLADFDAHGFAAFRDEWQRHAAYLGEAVRLTPAQGAPHEGVFAGVDERGALLLDGEAGRRALFAGELSLRPIA